METQLIGRDGSPVRMSTRDVSPRRFTKRTAVPVEQIEHPTPNYMMGQRFADLVIPDKTV
jgi:hypothetical protein